MTQFYCKNLIFCFKSHFRFYVKLMFISEHKKIVNFVYLVLRFSTTCATNKKAHDCSRAFLVFLFVALEIVEISEL